jgi:hypothetical protein
VRGALSNERPYRDYKMVLPRESRALLSRFPADAALGRTVRGRQEVFDSEEHQCRSAPDLVSPDISREEVHRPENLG